MEAIPADQPRRARRSSISDHIHRVFSNKRHSQAEFIPPVPFLAREALAQDSNSYARHSLYDETGLSSRSYSSNSRLPSTGTPGSSPSVANGASVDDTPTQQMTPLPIHPNGDGDNKAPTLDKTKKKEKRVTRRLEAERKELEKRLLALEDAQSKPDLGIHGRSSRRLTKKQPVGSSSRSSSANAERPRSSSSFSSIFRRSRRNSNSSDVDSPSPEFSQLRTDTNPPSLPLTLPERFGTAITRELQSKHGTALNLPASNKMPNATQHSHFLHSSPKSDDLRENWKMAEAWKKKNGLSSQSVSGHNPNGNRSILGKAARNREKLASSNDLDREMFSAALKHDRKSVPATENPADRVIDDRSVRATSMPMSQSLSQPNFHPSYPDSPTQVTTARQLQEMTLPETSENASIQPNARLSQTNATGNPARKNRADPLPRAYKSSPLALNPANTDESPQDDTSIPRLPIAQNLDHASPSQPPHSPAQPLPAHTLPEDRERSRLPVASSHTPKRTASRFKENFQESLQPAELPQIPVKSKRRSQENWRMPTASADTPRDITTSPLQVLVRSPFHTGSVSSDERSSRTSKDLSDGTYAVPARSPRRASCTSPELPGNILAVEGPGGFIPGHSRTPSHTSSHDGHSNYDTADENTPDSPGFKRNSLTRVDTSPSVSAIEAPVVQEAPVSPLIHPNLQPGIQSSVQPSVQPVQLSNQPVFPPVLQPGSHRDTYRGIQYGPQPGTQPDIHPGIQTITQPGTENGSPQTRSSPMSILKRRSQKTKSAHNPQTIAKVFVICCRCKYWHDLPSEVYARLTYPESIASASKPGRSPSKTQPDSSTRKLTGSKSLSFGHFPAPHAAKPDLRPAPLLLRKVTCCWCGHNMSRSCCEGWATAVEMRERQH
ncbi:hypothetical protein N7491_008148 [Penicillium cf. griseofulvum]|uniref:Uncharacterized protein n=1 Tax=Penicillium cf. griseofulvum TaxID=2972120 RepID=A0A9W9J397_9EURO|nr:hypothetical protein N7472_008822 [Penicillium cf. griseofulvum]KAJ5427706.1 hypothetical protein N7491_008148 [Penicillium cf. griseofulvum]KAJ5431905.1 hypothetical protein N7445_008403 [Penicillium cf. griseofulvum]